MDGIDEAKPPAHEVPSQDKPGETGGQCYK
jgi:hypothetical protein